MGGYRHCGFGHFLGALVECADGKFVDCVNLLVCADFLVLFLSERWLKAECGEHIHTEVFVFVLSAIALNDVANGLEEHIHNINADAFAHKCVVATCVNHLALRIHHVVVFEQTLADAEVVFLNAFLGVLDGVGHHLSLDWLAFLEPEMVEHLDYAVGGKQTHHGVFKRHEEY